MTTVQRTYLIVVSLVTLWCLAIVAAPLASAWLGREHTVAASLYSFLNRICHQIAERSFSIAGEPFSVCIRCSSLYGAFLIGLFTMPALPKARVTNIPPPLWLLIAIAPMVVDVILQVFGLHPSTTFTRIVTGSAVGLVLPFYLLPPLFEAVQSFRHQLIHRGGSIHARKTE